VIPLLGESATAYNNMGQELLAQFFHPSAVNNFILAGLRNQQKHRHDNRVTFSPLGSKLYDISLSISELDPFQSLYNALHVKAPFAPCTFWTNRRQSGSWDGAVAKFRIARQKGELCSWKPAP